MNRKTQMPESRPPAPPRREEVAHVSETPEPAANLLASIPMTRRQWLKAALVAILAKLMPWNLAGAADAELPDGTVTAVYLSWQGDPTTTMTIFWHSVGFGEASELLWREAGAKEFRKAAGTRRPFPYSNRSVNHVQLTGLKPDTEYEFQVTGPATAAILPPMSAPGASFQRQFRTAPADSTRPVKFVVGGDAMRTRKMMQETCLAAAKADPLFVIIGGDLAYEDGLPANVGRWYDFFECWTQTMVTPEGRVIPIIPTIGNHEVRGAYGRTPKEAVGYYAAFALPLDEGTYRTVDFGNYLSFILLDSGHTASVNGKQTQWLAQKLLARANVDHVYPVYHVPAYPGHGPFMFPESVLMRECWCPLFDKANIDIVFENHDHLFHRSKRIRAGKADPQGVLYLGDGCWGVEPRDLKSEPHMGAEEIWYIDQGKSVRHFMSVTITGKSRKLEVIDSTGAVIDQLARSERVGSSEVQRMA